MLGPDAEKYRKKDIDQLKSSSRLRSRERYNGKVHDHRPQTW